jgi:hypothetical protein
MGHSPHRPERSAKSKRAAPDDESMSNRFDSRDAADSDLRIAMGRSTLFNQNGDQAYFASATFKVSILANDVCSYAEMPHEICRRVSNADRAEQARCKMSVPTATNFAPRSISILAW